MINKWIGIGNVVADPELRVTPNGKAVGNFSIACNEKYKDEDRVEYVNIVVWQKLAEICKEHLTKGKQVYIEGRLQTSTWDDKETGKKRYKTEVVANVMRMLGSKEAASPQRELPKDDSAWG